DLFPMANVLIGPSIENQATCDVRWPHAATLAALGWRVMVSFEPLLGEIFAPYTAQGQSLAWAIIGGASGPDARGCRIDWIRRLICDLRRGDVPTFVKQIGSNPLRGSPSDFVFFRGRQAAGGDRALRHAKGGDPDEWPHDIRLRQPPRALDG